MPNRTTGVAKLPVYAPAPTTVDAAELLKVRRFHLDAAKPAATDEEFWPALLWALRQPQKVRTDYPLVVFPPGTSDRPCQPFGQALQATLADLKASGQECRLLADNAVRLELALREQLSESDSHNMELLRRSASRMIGRLALQQSAGEKLAAEVDAWLARWPDATEVVDLDTTTWLRLYIHAGLHHATQRREALGSEVAHLIRALRGLLQVEQHKAPGQRSAEAFSKSLAATGLINAAALSQAVGEHRGSVVMSEERRLRIEGALADLERFQSDPGPVLLCLHDGPLPLADAPAGVEFRGDADPLASVEPTFEDMAATYSKLFRAMRTAELELAKPGGSYDPSLHDAWFEQFDWRSFSEQEVLSLPAMVVQVQARVAAGDGMQALSRLLVSGRRVQVVVKLDPAQDPGRQGEGYYSARFELGYLGIGHRVALVHQSATARPGHLFEGFARALASSGAALHVVADEDPSALGVFLYGSAAVEARAHPIFLYDPARGTTWARRVDFSGNPEPNTDFASYPVVFRTPSGAQEEVRLSFTVADLVLLDPRQRHHFERVPEGARASDDLVPVEEYLKLDPEAAMRAVPVVRAIDSEAQLVELAISRELASACRDRLAFWRTLQELSGVRNEYVEAAIERTVAQERERAAAERQQLEANHAQEIERVRNATATQVLERLAASLLADDPAALLGGGEPQPPAASQVEPAPEPAEAAPPKAEAEPLAEEVSAQEPEAEEPWVDSALCTSCNDCINLNPLLFVYNADKQAEIKDPRAGTYKQLVTAAEKCPARCIHPGKPLDPREPGLEDLMRRAKPFN